MGGFSGIVRGGRALWLTSYGAVSQLLYGEGVYDRDYSFMADGSIPILGVFPAIL